MVAYVCVRCCVACVALQHNPMRKVMRLSISSIALVRFSSALSVFSVQCVRLALHDHCVLGCSPTDSHSRTRSHAHTHNHTHACVRSFANAQTTTSRRTAAVA